MSELIAKFVFNKILRENAGNDNGTDDPYFETVPAGRLSHGGKTKRRKKALPPGLSGEDEKTLIKVKRRAYRLDMALGSFFGMKVGWSSLIAIIPGIGDVIDSKIHTTLFTYQTLLMSYYNSVACSDGHPHSFPSKPSLQCHDTDDV